MARRKHKAFILIQQLDRNEAKAFEQHLQGQKRETLLPLYRQLKRYAGKPEPPGKEVLYKAVFKKQYQKQNDYLLRNEFRLLTQELQAFFSSEQQKTELKEATLQQLYYLKWLAGKQAFDLFEAEAEELKVKLNGLCRHREYADLLQTYIDAFIFQKEATVPNYNDLLNLMREFYHQQGLGFLHQHSEVRLKQAFAERTLQAVTGGQHEVLPVDDIHFNRQDEQWQEPYLQYLYCSTIAYRQSGPAKLQTLKAAADHLQQVSKKGFDREGALSSNAASIALEYFLLGEYEQSVPYHKQALKHAEGLPDSRVIAYVFNYLSTLIRLADYPAAVALVEDYRPVWQDFSRMKDRFLCLLAMCHIFLNDHEAAWSCIPENRKQGGVDHYYYYRFVHLIVLLKRGDRDIALMEVDNFIHAVRNHDKDERYLKLTLLLKRYIKLMMEQNAMDETINEKKRTELQNDLQTQREQVAQPDMALLYRWLVGEVG